MLRSVRRLVSLLVAFVCLGGLPWASAALPGDVGPPGAARAAPPHFTFHADGSIAVSDPTHTGYLVISAAASSCASPKATPSFSGSLNFHYDMYTLVNTDGVDSCVTVTVDGTNCASNGLWAFAYLPSFNPANVPQNYLADAGASAITGPRSFSFAVPAGATFVVEVEEIDPGNSCAAYTLDVTSVALPTPTPTSTATPTATGTVTVTSTSTATGTPSATATNTATSTPAATSTGTSTATTTPTVTPTVAPPATWTPSPTGTAQPSATGTPLPPTATANSTPTPSGGSGPPGGTSTPTRTPTPLAATPTPVIPEAPPLWLFGSGLLALGWLGARRRYG